MVGVQDTLFCLFVAVSVLYVVHIGLYLIGANIYDMWQYRRRNVYDQILPVTRPLVTVAISAHNEEKVIARCLESIRQSDYPNIEVLVADDASTDHTRQIVRNYILQHRDRRIRMYHMPKNIGKGKALNTVLRRRARGLFVMTVDADSVISHDAITNAISYFADPSVAGVAANVQIIFEPTVLGLLQKFEHMVGYRSKKAYSMLNSEFVVGGVASTYRMRVLRQVNFYDTDTITEDIGLSIKVASMGNKRYRMVYAADVVAKTEGVASFRGLLRQRFRWKYGSLQNLVKYRHLIGKIDPKHTPSLTLYRLPMAILSEIVLLVTPLAWFYAVYMTLSQYSPILLLGAYVTITAYILIIVWFDERLPARMRLLLTVYAPLAYFMFYVMELVQLIAVIRCSGRLFTLLRQGDKGSVWASPERIGKELATYET